VTSTWILHSAFLASLIRASWYDDYLEMTSNCWVNGFFPSKIFNLDVELNMKLSLNPFSSSWSQRMNLHPHKSKACIMRKSFRNSPVSRIQHLISLSILEHACNRSIDKGCVTIPFPWVEISTKLIKKSSSGSSRQSTSLTFISSILCPTKLLQLYRSCCLLDSLVIC